MIDLPLQAPKILALYLQMAQYPILARRIRRRMREELYRRGVITPTQLEQEVREKALLSQRREGLTDPLIEEDAQQWDQRLQQIMDTLTDFYFAYNLPLELFDQIVQELLAERSVRRGDVGLTFNPELAPLDILLNQAERYEALPAGQQARVSHHLEEIMVVLTRMMISDQLGFVRVAKCWFRADDFKYILSHRIGSGKIGGKAGGMLLAWKILQSSDSQLAQQVVLPRSYFVGSDVFYDFHTLNHLEYIDQKYKPLDQIRIEYPEIRERYARGRFPVEITERLREILHELGKTPLIVRSSSLLEDNFGTSFAGKYASFFCPNQGTLKENLRDLTLAIRRIYASVYNPDVLLYRRRMGLLDYDERMAILLQEVQGQTYHHYFFPTLAGVAFGHSPIVWNPRLRREEGFVRLVLGMGTRAVDRVADDYPRLINLSHPLLRPEVTPAAIRHYSQHFVDLIDLQENRFTTLPLREVLDLDFPALRWLASEDQGDTLLPIFSFGPELTPDRLVLTFDNLLQRSRFVPLLKQILSILNQQYQFPVDMEFTVTLSPETSPPGVTIHLLQCRPQSSLQRGEVFPVPTDLTAEDKLFIATRMVPQGYVGGIEYIVYVDPVAYSEICDPVRCYEVARIVSRLNRSLEGHHFILIGPGRWGSQNVTLGVPISYADIYNTSALVELAIPRQGITPEPSYGTHFFQDLVESRIYPLAIYPQEPGDLLNQEFLDRAQNQLATLRPEDAGYAHIVKVIHIPSERPGRTLTITMDGERALAYLSPRTGD